MKNFLQNGDLITCDAPSDVKSGDIVVIGQMACVAVTDAQDQSVTLSTTGVFSLPKVKKEVFTPGQRVYTKDGLVTGEPKDAVDLGFALKACSQKSEGWEVLLR